MIEEARYRVRMTIAIFKKFYDGDNPIVADAAEVQKLRTFNLEVMGAKPDWLKGPIAIYGAPVVDENGKPWEW